jgi:hypothetical protein
LEIPARRAISAREIGASDLIVSRIVRSFSRFRSGGVARCFGAREGMSARTLTKNPLGA